MTKNRTPTPVYLDPGMHHGLEVKGLSVVKVKRSFAQYQAPFGIQFTKRFTPRANIGSFDHDFIISFFSI